MFCWSKIEAHMENKKPEEASSTPTLSSAPSAANPNEKPLKLNYKRTLIIGFAFFGILLLWQVYDSWCPTFLTELFAKKMYPNETTLTTAEKLDVQYLVGIMMAIDNMAALFMLPIFGSWSDKTHTKIGKRMPFILIGTLVAAICFPFIPLFFHNGSLVGTICMLPKYGKAAVHAAKAKGVVDQGALAGKYMLEGIESYFVSRG